jgi:hypothetical protein
MLKNLYESRVKSGTNSYQLTVAKITTDLRGAIFSLRLFIATSSSEQIFYEFSYNSVYLSVMTEFTHCCICASWLWFEISPYRVRQCTTNPNKILLSIQEEDRGHFFKCNIWSLSDVTLRTIYWKHTKGLVLTEITDVDSCYTEINFLPTVV